MKILLAPLLLLSTQSFSCTVDDTPFQEYIHEADYVFLGAVVEMHWANFEARYSTSAKAADLGEPSGIIEIPAVYRYRAVPSTVYKGPDKPPDFFGGYCHGALVDGGSEYIIVGFKDGASVAYSVHSSSFDQIREYLDKNFVSQKPE